MRGHRAGRVEVTAAESERDPSEPDAAPALQATRWSEDFGQRIAVLASRVRARLLFIVLDTACVVAAYGASEVFYWRHVAPAAYGWHFAVFVLLVVVVTLASNQIFGLYGRIWRHAGLEEALRYETAGLGYARRAPNDVAEAGLSFRERRPPTFTGT